MTRRPSPHSFPLAVFGRLCQTAPAGGQERLKRRPDLRIIYRRNSGITKLRQCPLRRGQCRGILLSYRPPPKIDMRNDLCPNEVIQSADGYALSQTETLASGRDARLSQRVFHSETWSVAPFLHWPDPPPQATLPRPDTHAVFQGRHCQEKPFVRPQQRNSSTNSWADFPS